jgi:hypothetical protein
LKKMKLCITHMLQEHIAFLWHRPWERGYSTGFSGPASYLRGNQGELLHRVHQVRRCGL